MEKKIETVIMGYTLFFGTMGWDTVRSLGMIRPFTVAGFGF